MMIKLEIKNFISKILLVITLVLLYINLEISQLYNYSFGAEISHRPINVINPLSAMMVCPKVNPPNQATELVLIKYEMMGAMIHIGITKLSLIDRLVNIPKANKPNIGPYVYPAKVNS